MLKRIALYLSVAGLLVGMAFFLGAGWNARSGAAAEVENNLELLYGNIETENWPSALVALDELEKAWATIYDRLNFIEDRLLVFQFDTDLAKIRGAILAEDRASCLQLAWEMKSIWARY